MKKAIIVCLFALIFHGFVFSCYGTDAGNAKRLDRQNRLSDYFHLMKDNQVEKIVKIFEDGLYEKDLPPERLSDFYMAAMHIGIHLHDYQRAIMIAQIGKDFCDRLIASKTVDVLPGDGGVYFQRCQMLRTKAQMLAYLDDVDPAIVAMNDALSALWKVFSDPEFRIYATNPVNGGFAITFGQIVVPVLESIRRNHGEEDALKALPIAKAAMASQSEIIHSLNSSGKMEGMHATNYLRMTAWQNGEILLSAGLATEALKILEAAPLDKGMTVKTHVFLANLFLAKARAQLAVGNTKAARAITDEVRQSMNKSNNTFMGAYRWVPPYLLGQIDEAENNLDAAATSYNESIGVIRDTYRKLTTSTARREYLKDSDDVYARLIRLLLKQGKTREAVERIEESHGKDVLDLFGETLNQPQRSWGEDKKIEIRKFRKELFDLDLQEKGTGRTGEKRSMTREDREQVRATRQRALAGLEKAIQEARASSKTDSQTSVSIRQSQESFEGKNHRISTLIESKNVTTILFQTRRDPCWALVLGEGMTKAIPLSTTAAKIRITAGKFRRAAINDEQEWKEKSFDLYKQILLPLEDQLKGKKRILVIPDGSLWYAPFAALLDAAEEPLVRKFQIGICSTVNLSAALIERARQMEEKGVDATQKPGKILILADPDGSLPHAREEGVQIAALASASNWQHEIRTGSEAAEIWFKKALAGVNRGALHFATHGILDSASPLFSYLLAGSGDGEDGKIEVLEIGNELNLSHFSPAVLSACNTAMGTISGGNEMICLQQAFHDAGVPEILASLWEVSDESTLRLMKEFYAKYFAGVPVSQALAEAIRTMTSEPPSRWSAFQLYGAP